MSVKIRLKRIGTKKTACYRMVVADQRMPRNGRFIEEIGFYDPLKEPVDLRIDADKAKKWIANGAQPSETVRALLIKGGVIPAVKKTYKPKKPAVKPAEKTEAKPAAKPAEK